ncbi:MAG TPA: hypothetical protein VFB94_28450 [Acidimicrobiales bacterium]|nr:hypothetical protein [Acidimicrobiales bacterium]
MVMPNGDGNGRAVPPESVEAEPGAAGAGEEAAGAVREGQRILRFDVYATVVFAVVSLLEAVLPEPLVVLSVPLDLVLFVVGCGAFLWAYAVAVGRSRYEVLTMGGVFFPGRDVVPAVAVRVLRLCLLAQVVVAVVAASVRPFTPSAFAVLVPMLGVGLMALYGARYGRFPAKDEPGDQSDEADAPGQ